MGPKIFTNSISLLLLFNLNILCISENDAKITSAYEYITENTPEKIKIIWNEFLKNGTNKELIDFYAPILADDELCRNQSLMYKNSFKNFDVWALKMWDSSGKLPSGILDAHFFELGNYHECLETAETGPFHVKYCIVEVENVLPRAIHHPEFDESEKILFGNIRPIKGNLYLARCVPASCDTENLVNYYTNVVREFNMTINIGKFSCTATNESDPFTLWDWAAIMYIFVITSLLVSSAIVYKVQLGNKKNGLLVRLLSCFAPQNNINEVFSTKDMNSDLSFLNGIRIILMTMTLFSHMVISSGFFPKINYLQEAKDFSKPTMKFVFAYTNHLVVDAFLIIGGLLTSYILIKDYKLRKNSVVQSYFIKKVFRIIPSYAAQILIYSTIVYRYIGSGPLWKINMGLARDNCFKNWWTNLLFINNYVNQDELCIAANWYLAVYMQLQVIGLLIFFPMLKWPKFRKYGIPLIITICHTWMFYRSYVNVYRAGPALDVNYRTEKMNQYLYVATEGRISIWILGLYLGYILQKIEDSPQKPHLSKVILHIGWSLTILMQILAVMSMYYFMSDHVYSNIIHSAYNGFHRIIFAPSICWFIYACKLGYGGFIHKFLTWYPLQVISRFSFSIYMSQMIVLGGIDSLTTTSLQYQPVMEVRNSIGNIVICFMLSLYLYLVFELPYINIGRILSEDIRKKAVVVKQESQSNNHNKKDL